MVMQTVESVCSTLGLKLGQRWKSYLTELPKLPWTSLYLTPLGLENYDEDMKDCVLYALYYGPCGLKTNDFSSVDIHKDDSTEEVMNVDPLEVQCPENVVRKEKLMNLDYVINTIKCVHELILIQCVFIGLHVNMGLTLSVLRVRFYFYCEEYAFK